MSTMLELLNKDEAMSCDTNASVLKKLADELERDPNAEKFFVGKSFVEDVYSEQKKNNTQ